MVDKYQYFKYFKYFGLKVRHRKNVKKVTAPAPVQDISKRWVNVVHVCPRYFQEVGKRGSLFC
jgi:hypothetical protein